MTLRLLDLFAGIGGFSLAAEWVGWTVAGQVEIDPWRQRVLAKLLRAARNDVRVLLGMGAE